MSTPCVTFFCRMTLSRANQVEGRRYCAKVCSSQVPLQLRFAEPLFFMDASIRGACRCRILWNYYLFLRERFFAFFVVRDGVLEMFFLFCGVNRRKNSRPPRGLFRVAVIAVMALPGNPLSLLRIESVFP